MDEVQKLTDRVFGVSVLSQTVAGLFVQIDNPLSQECRLNWLISPARRVYCEITRAFA